MASDLTLENAPIGTRAPAIGGGYWERVANGWKWCTGSTFPRPGGDWTGTLILPAAELDAQQQPADGEWVLVPKEATPAMVAAAHKVWSDHEAQRVAIAGLGGHLTHGGWAESYYTAMLAAAPTPAADAQQRRGDGVEPFAVKQYQSEERPSLKGNGFDGLEVGEDRAEAQEFVDWINARIAASTPTAANAAFRGKGGADG